MGRADIEGSQNNVAMTAWLPQTSDLPVACSDRDGAGWGLLSPSEQHKNEIIPVVTFLTPPAEHSSDSIRIRIEHVNQASVSRLGPHGISVLSEPTFDLLSSSSCAFPTKQTTFRTSQSITRTKQRPVVMRFGQSEQVK